MTTPADDAFTVFLTKFGDPVGRQQVPSSSIERYRGKLPELLLRYWQEHGWCGYGGGIFWLVDPQEFECVLDAWLGGTAFNDLDTYHVIARSAFGDLYLWGEAMGDTLVILSNVSRCLLQSPVESTAQMDEGMENFLRSMEVAYNDFQDLFQPAREHLGALQADEMYGFVPALGLGGSVSLTSLERLKAVEHLMILSQIAPLRLYEFPDDEDDGGEAS